MQVIIKNSVVIATYEDAVAAENVTCRVPQDLASLFAVGEPDPRPDMSEADRARIVRIGILAELTALDMTAVRPLRAIAAGAGTQDDSDRLAALESKAATLRADLAALQA